MALKSLGYVVVSSNRFEDWTQFGVGLLGMQAVDRGRDGLAFRLDERPQRLILERGAEERCTAFGWEVEDQAAIERLAARVEAAGAAVKNEPQSLSDRRLTSGLISFHDPAGNRLEVFHGAQIAESPFQPGRNISGFRAGALGLGHVVLTTDNIARLTPFYQDVLGFRLSDFTQRPFKAFFFHINERHHSFAMVETGVNGVHHVMVELLSLDDVGQGYDLAQRDKDRVAVTLGRHSNDLMTSFYVKTPSGFMMEYGWGGRSIDPATWEPFECDWGPSLWGHDRSWLSPEKQEEARALRQEAARLGYREPVYVLEGNHVVMPGPARTP